MKTYGEMEVQIHEFLTLALDGGEWLASCPCHFTPRERTPINRKLGGLLSWFGHGGKEKNSLPMQF
jgi:hypothetical protein